MPLPLLAGAVISKFGPRALSFARSGASALVSKFRGGGGPIGTATTIAGRKGLPPALMRGGRRRRGRVPSLTPNELGKLMLMSQIFGKKSPAMTLVVMKALSGRL